MTSAEKEKNSTGKREGVTRNRGALEKEAREVPSEEVIFPAKT